MTCLALVALSILLLVAPACNSSAGEAKRIRLSGTGDLYYLSVVINKKAQELGNIPSVKMQISSDSIKELKKGKSDAVLLGREPDVDELNGLIDTVIALDAVCIIIDENTFLGGEVRSGKRPVRKSPGLQELSSEALRAIFSGEDFKWSGPGYFDGNRTIDENSFLLSVDAVAWLPAEKKLDNYFIFPPGKFDTQSVLYQALGMSEQTLLAGVKGGTSQQYHIEEEVLSNEYDNSAYSQNSGTQDFAFKLAFASRRAMTVAPLHVPVRVLKVDGIDPLVDSGSIYDGSYFSPRKIHVLSRLNSTPAVSQLIDFLQSADGQLMLTEAGYLPLKKDLLAN